MKPLTYASSGVSLGAWEKTFKKIKPLIQATRTPGVLSSIGSFGGLFAVSKKIKDPVLVASTDGVGTKLKIAFMAGRHDTVGRDLVNHCVNDILVQGARPLFFMDYIACGRLKPRVAESLLRGFAYACKAQKIALLGGETAEMPGFYQKGEYDLSGFIVGAVERKKIITGAAIKRGDLLYGLPSSGLHTNGYSLARKIFFERARWKVSRRVPELGTTLGKALLAVHRSYAETLRGSIDAGLVKGMAHITGGGFSGNVPRILPSSCDAVLFKKTWEPPPIFRLMQTMGRISDTEMYRAFNMGIGMVVAVSPKDSAKFERRLRSKRQTFYVIGEAARGDGRVRWV